MHAMHFSARRIFGRYALEALRRAHDGRTIAAMEIGEVVRTLREHAGISQQELAVAAGGEDYNQPNISRFENGSKRIPLEAVERMAARLGVTMLDLYYLASTPPGDAKWRQWLRVYRQIPPAAVDAVLALAPPSEKPDPDDSAP